MAQEVEIKIPDIGDFKDVPITEILVASGDVVKREDPIIALETDKASIEIPSPEAGIVQGIKIKVGDRVSEGSPILTLAITEQPVSLIDSETTIVTSKNTPTPANPTSIAVSAQSVPAGDIHADVVVLGAGPGGYTAAFRAADLGKKVILIERHSVLGGVCLNVGCIPSKALLHAARVITEAEEIEKQGIVFAKPTVNIDKLRIWKDSVITKLTKGLEALAKQRQVKIIHGTGKFITTHQIQIETVEGPKIVSFDHCIIAAGSSVTRIPGFPYSDPRLIDSTGALKLIDVPQHMLIIGGGIIGLEMAAMYSALGSRISVVEQMDQLISGADPDLIKPLHQRIKKRYEAIYLKTKVTQIKSSESGLTVDFEGENAPQQQIYDRILIAVGRYPNGHLIGARDIGIEVNERGFILVDQQMRTNLLHIFAIGDIVGEPMLAHKAMYEGKLVAEIIAGHKGIFDARTIPSVAYTDPEIAWMGLTEKEAVRKGIDYEKTIFPWAASGRAISMARNEGLTKLLLDKVTRRILGAGIVGINAGELIAEMVLALEMGADMQDISLTIHPHPTLSETALFAAEMAEGTITDLFLPKK